VRQRHDELRFGQPVSSCRNSSPEYRRNDRPCGAQTRTLGCLCDLAAVSLPGWTGVLRLPVIVIAHAHGILRTNIVRTGSAGQGMFSGCIFLPPRSSRDRGHDAGSDVKLWRALHTPCPQRGCLSPFWRSSLGANSARLGLTNREHWRDFMKVPASSILMVLCLSIGSADPIQNPKSQGPGRSVPISRFHEP
jgi:hypothetical protein